MDKKQQVEALLAGELKADHDAVKAAEADVKACEAHKVLEAAQNALKVARQNLEKTELFKTMRAKQMKLSLKLKLAMMEE